MYKGKKVVVVSPVGREQSMKILFPYILSNKGIVDEHHLWVNTSDENDLKFINDYYESNKDFVVLKEGCTELWEDQKGRSSNVKHFYNYCIEKDTFYFKIDDDIIFIENGLFEDLIDFKLENPEYFLLYPLIINNTWCTHYMRENEVLDIQESEICSKLWTFYYDKISDNLRSLSETMSENLDEPRLAKVIPEKALLCPIYWGDTTFAYNLLNLFQEVYREGKIEELKIPNIILNKHESASINVCCWQGSDFKQFGGDVRSSEDESWLTTFYPAYVNKKNVIVGSKIAVHYSYYTQRSELNKTDILSKYYEIIPKV
jgi:hypothetical protein